MVVSRIKQAASNPKKAAIHLKRNVVGWFHSITYRRKWEKDASGIDRKDYKRYEDYIKHQKSKLDIMEGYLSEYDQTYRVQLRERLQKHKMVKAGSSVLCLAARIGTEVKSFIDLDCFAIGIDLNPGKNNKYVVHGDFHDLQYADGTVDIVFCNSLDHAYDFERLIKEVSRVLKPQGQLILEIVKGEDEGVKASHYESQRWNKADDVLQLFTRHGFSIVKREEFNKPWPGNHVYLVKEIKTRSTALRGK